jgi:cell division transport system permease protein
MPKQKKPRTRRFFNLHFTATISISLVLFLVGLIALLMIVGRSVSTYVKENMNMSIVLDDSISSDGLKTLNKVLKTTSFAKSFEYIDKEQALREHIRDLGENPKDFLGYNPLLASFEVKLASAYANTDSVAKIEGVLKKHEGVKQVIYQKDIIHLVNDNINKTGFVLACIAAILLFVSVVLLNNTIRISVYSKRFVINTMQLVGAKAWFIRRPFILRSMLNGLISSVIALGLLAGASYYMQFELGTGFNFYSWNVLAPVCSVVIGFSLIITFFASLFAVNRYLRMHTDSLYYI